MHINDEKRRNLMRTKLATAITGLGLLASAAPVWAHHAFAAEFDATKPLKLHGTVTNWMVEGGSPNTLLRNGFTKASLPVGTEIVVDGYQSKDESNKMNGRDITFPDGRKLFVGSAGQGQSPDKSDK